MYDNKMLCKVSSTTEITNYSNLALKRKSLSFSDLSANQIPCGIHPKSPSRNTFANLQKASFRFVACDLIGNFTAYLTSKRSMQLLLP